MADTTTIKYKGKTLGEVPNEIMKPVMETGVVNANQLSEKQLPEVIETPLDTTKQLLTTDIETSPLIRSQTEALQQKQTQALKEIEQKFGTTGTTAREALTTAIEKEPVLDTEKRLAEAQAKYGVTDLTTKVQEQTIKATEARNAITTLNAELTAKKEAVETRLVSRGSISAEQGKLEREYSYKIAKATATYAAEAAMAEALSGNLTTAQNLVNQAVDAYTADIDSEIDRFDKLFSIYSDYVDELGEEEKNILNTAYNELKDEASATKEEKTEVGNLMLEYNAYGAGITLDDDLDTALEKASIGEQTKLEETTTTTLDFTDQEKRKLQALGIDYTTSDGYEKALNTLYNPNQYLSNEDRKEKLMSAITETMQESLGEYFTLDSNRLKLTAEDYLAIQRAWEDLSGTSSDFKIYFPKGQYMEESEQEAYKNLTGSGELDSLNSLLKAFEE